jgi:hypothetical protein
MYCENLGSEDEVDLVGFVYLYLLLMKTYLMMTEAS